jgi:ubiquinone/menaquinone biosynthesis C-methylase UbiE
MLRPVTRQRETFDQVARLYDEVRPQVPPVAVEARWRSLALSPGDAALEVGCGTGQLTKHLAVRVLALEPGGGP